MVLSTKTIPIGALDDVLHTLSVFYQTLNSTDGYNGTITNFTISDESAVNSGSSTETETATTNSDTSDEGISILSVVILSVVLLGIVIGVSGSYFRNNSKERASFSAINPIQTDPHLKTGNEDNEDDGEGNSGETFSLVGKNVLKSSGNEV